MVSEVCGEGLHGEVSRVKFPQARQPVCEPLRYFDRSPGTIVRDEVPDLPATAGGEQTELPVARLAPQEVQHHPRVGAGQPLLLRHGLLLAQQKVYHPAPTDMWTWPAEVDEQVRVGAASVLQGVGKHSKACGV
jgi:hypothetical protein